MKNRIVLCLSCCLSSIFSLAYSDSTIAANDFKNLIGCWNGSLTYLDYSTNKPFSMPANIIARDFKRNNKIVFSLIYPKEPGANSSDTIFISNNGRILNGEVIKLIKRFNRDSIEIVTEAAGIDGNDNKEALFRHTYILGKNTYSTQKEVLFIGQNNWILRNKYQFIRVKPCS